MSSCLSKVSRNKITDLGEAPPALSGKIILERLILIIHTISYRTL